MFEKIRNAFNRYLSSSMRNEFNDAMRQRDFSYALLIADDYKKNISLSSSDLNALELGLHQESIKKENMLRELRLHLKKNKPNQLSL